MLEKREKQNQSKIIDGKIIFKLPVPGSCVVNFFSSICSNVSYIFIGVIFKTPNRSYIVLLKETFIQYMVASTVL